MDLIVSVQVQFSPEEYLHRAGEIASEMYFVVSGSVEEINDTSDSEVYLIIHVQKLLQSSDVIYHSGRRSITIYQ